MLDVFDIKLGTDVMPVLDAETKGLVAVQMLDAVQTIADVLTTNDGGMGWKVSFDPGINAYTDRESGKRHIVVSAKPMLDAKPGTPMADVAKVMTGFVVHEVGHTEIDFFEAVRARWPGKKLPLTLANIIEDVVLELRTVEHYRGFADYGEGNVFYPTLEWVAERTCPKTPLKWSGSTGHKVNVTGQIVRYRPFVTFSPDEVTQTHLRWVEDEWMPGIHIGLTPSGCVELIERWLDYVKATMADDEEPEPPVTDGPTGTSTETSDQTIPDEDDNPGTEGGNEPTEGGDEPGGDGEDDEDGSTEGGDEPSDEPGGDTEGDRGGDGNDADHGDRVDLPKGSTDSGGSGGSGQGIAEATDPVDDYVEEDLPQSFDDLAKVDTADQHQQHDIARKEAEERVTTRLDAGAFGRMRVIFK
jgi:hypothetical protein